MTERFFFCCCIAMRGIFCFGLGWLGIDLKWSRGQTGLIEMMHMTMFHCMGISCL